MEAPPFTSYWLPGSTPAGPNSWAFFVVAQVAGLRRPLAVVSSIGDTAEEFESLQGYPLTACCRRILTIFADAANHPAIRAEVSLAAEYYATDGNSECRAEPVELPELTRRKHQERRRPWNRTRVCEFPFIAACLLQGVGFDAHTGRTAPALLEPLATVYRDSSTEWGMVVVDITDLDAIRYGIVGFAVSISILVPSKEREGSPFLFGDGMGRPAEGSLKVIDDLRPRRAMSAAKYMTKFEYEVPSYADTSELLARTQLVDTVAMSLIWPSGHDDGVHLLPSILPIGIEQTGKYCAISRFVQRVINLDQYYFDLSYFDKKLLSIPNSQDLLQHSVLSHLDQIRTSKSFGQLIRLAFVNQRHLSLERLGSLSAELIAAALDEPAMGKDKLDGGELTAVSFCIDRVQSTPAQIADVLLRFDTLREIYLLQSPTRESDKLSVQLFEELVARPQIFSRAKVMLAGAYSSALRKRPWLSPASTSTGQLAPLEVFPVQQMLIRFEVRDEHTFRGLRISPDYQCVCLSDGLLKPEHFAANFLLYIYTLEGISFELFDPKAQLFSLSSGPGSFTADLQSAAPVSPILAESFALPLFFPGDGVCSPLVRDLVPGGWTVIVSHEEHRPRDGSECLTRIRYAFVRPRRQSITVDRPPPAPLGPEDLEVVGLKEFLAAMAPEVDPTAVDRRAREIHQRLAASPARSSHISHPLAVLNQAEADQILLESFTNSWKREKPLAQLVEAVDEKWDVYSVYWEEKKKK
ncbi:hypothetical protein SAMD00023353_1601020 [Rosellinia necatrix]|uniref:Uncharacterized protein n=1 Tax=Rosellinia necatrix TaxID=77044 RepID=A0A1W2TIA6_ROSNE|nr:hypothetical protein SAMD00023353_1601020 [Rosellinia necatrix]